MASDGFDRETPHKENGDVRSVLQDALKQAWEDCETAAHEFLSLLGEPEPERNPDEIRETWNAARNAYERCRALYVVLEMMESES